MNALDQDKNTMIKTEASTNFFNAEVASGEFEYTEDLVFVFKTITMPDEGEIVTMTDGEHQKVNKS